MTLSERESGTISRRTTGLAHTQGCAATEAAPEQASKGLSLAERFLVDEVTAAQLCGVSRPTLRRWVDAGLLSSVALPFGLRRRLYRRSDVAEFCDRLADQA